MDLSRIEGTFKAPDDIMSIIGCGAIGSQLALQLVKLGCEKFRLYDFDTVEAHNFVNQAFRADQVGILKAQALAQLIKEINPHAKVECFTSEPETLLKQEETLEGYVFLGPDKASVRTHILKSNKTNPSILGWFDCRTELFAVQLFARPHTADGVKALLETLDFTDEEAEAAIPRSESGCHAKQASGITSATGAAVMAKLFVDFIKSKNIRTFTRVDLDNFDIESYS